MAGIDRLFEDFQPIAAIATTPGAVQQLQPLCEQLKAKLWVPAVLADLPGVTPYSGSLRDHLQQLWGAHRSLIFALASGAVVRLIAPLLSDKATDPAVVVVEETGKYVISLCSGHQGGSDRLTPLIAEALGATPVITGAAAAKGYVGIDLLGRPFGWQPGAGDWTAVSAAIARNEPIQVIQTAGSRLWQTHLPADHSFIFEDADVVLPSHTPEPKATKARIWISANRHSGQEIPQVEWHPRVLWLGIGCERGTSRNLIEKLIRQTCETYNLAGLAIAGVATLDRKADEMGLVELCRDRGWPLRCFAAEVLRQIEVPNPSTAVESEVGTPSVAEAAALVAASQGVGELEHGELGHGELGHGELSPGTATLIVTKQILRLASEPGAATLAIAESGREYIGKTGKLWLIGTGPGDLQQMTVAARTAVLQADVIVGYGLYLDLLKPLLRPGQILEPYPITQERQRAQRAIALAEWGLTVAVVSSGDAGIYGMAGLVLEALQAWGWNGKTPSVEVFPGVTALQAAAARVGSPLMHDFCAISLSDRLTPWEVIQTRLVAAAQADFVTAIYNPRSQTRIEQLQTAKEIFLNYRSPQTPVAIVRSAYRRDEQTSLTTLGELNPEMVDMFTTLIIGNRSTRNYADWLITPRGYLGF